MRTATIEGAVEIDPPVEVVFGHAAGTAGEPRPSLANALRAFEFGVAAVYLAAGLVSAGMRLNAFSSSWALCRCRIAYRP